MCFAVGLLCCGPGVYWDEQGLPYTLASVGTPHHSHSNSCCVPDSQHPSSTQDAEVLGLQACGATLDLTMVYFFIYLACVEVS